mmetsp:Transcript_27709/g.54400  ORF Transcript_27709/g.54400 Transcript_27709/m.54400 type:complete len:93 (+) Transcript_27709:1458-1736(+)
METIHLSRTRQKTPSWNQRNLPRIQHPLESDPFESAAVAATPTAKLYSSSSSVCGSSLAVSAAAHGLQPWVPLCPVGFYRFQRSVSLSLRWY